MNATVEALARDLAQALEARGYRRVRAYVIRRPDLGAGTFVGVIRRGYVGRLHAWARGVGPEDAIRRAFAEAGVRR